MAKINSGFCCTIVATAVLLTACSKAEKQASDFSGRSSDPMLAPIFDPQAPTVKTLIDKGFLIVDEREASVKCGWFSFCDGFDALYLGSQGRSDDISGVANFACPGTDDHSDNWKCRELKPPYVPNHGFVR